MPGRSDSHVTTHRAGMWSGRRRSPRWVRPVVVIVAALAGAGLLVGAGLVVTNASHHACSGPTTKITAVASPGEFQALDAIARQWTATGSSVDGQCAGASVVL